MQCPHCGQRPLCACYRTLPVLPPLDSHLQPRVHHELAHLSCEHCESMWYAFPGETVEAAYQRICKEEPRP